MTKRERGEVASAVYNILETDLPDNSEPIKMKKLEPVNIDNSNYKKRDRGELASVVFNVVGKQMVDDIANGTVTSTFVANELTSIPTTAPSTVQSIMPVIDAKKKTVHCTGYLLKQGAKVRSWKKRYFILHQRTMKYFTGEGGKLINTIQITPESGLEVITRKKTNYLQLTNPDRVWLFTTIPTKSKKKPVRRDDDDDDDDFEDDEIENINEAEFERWRSAIQNAIWIKAA